LWEKLSSFAADIALQEELAATVPLLPAVEAAGVEEDGKKEEENSSDEEEDEDMFAAYRRQKYIVPASTVSGSVETCDARRLRIDSAVRVEILKYKLVPHESKRKFDTLAWWRKHRFEYPYLAAIARLAFAVPATSAPSERIFSVCGLIVTTAGLAINL
jgi:hypothetical protein